MADSNVHIQTKIYVLLLVQGYMQQGRQENITLASVGLALLTVALPPSPAVDAVEQRVEDDYYQHAHHYPHRVRA